MYLWSVQWLKLCVDLYCYKYFHVQFMEVLYMWLQVNFVIPLSGCWNLELFPHNLSTILFESLWYRLLLALDYVLVVLHDHGCSLILCLQKPFQFAFLISAASLGTSLVKDQANLECLEACLLWIPCDSSLRSCFRSNIVQSYYIKPYFLFKMAISMYTLCLQEHWRRQNTIHL